MSEQEIYERLNEVFRNVFDDDDIEVEAGTTADDIEDWDSLEHINLISCLLYTSPSPRDRTRSSMPSSA